MLFNVEIDEEWLDVLDSLIQTAIGNAATPEEAMETIILSQLRLQRVKMQECKPSMSER